jgi:acyl-CoA thioester hydrolase
VPFRHELRVRYGEVDMQGHVFNAHYLAYADDALNAWLRSALGEDYYGGDGSFDMVLKRAELTWHGSASFNDALTIDVAVRRWGTTSFDVAYEGAVGERPVFEALVTYISIKSDGDASGHQAVPVPDDIRTRLS